jgi:hypothetical protein
MSGKLRESLVELPIANFFRSFSDEWSFSTATPVNDIYPAREMNILIAAVSVPGKSRDEQLAK